MTTCVHSSHEEPCEFCETVRALARKDREIARLRRATSRLRRLRRALRTVRDESSRIELIRKQFPGVTVRADMGGGSAAANAVDVFMVPRAQRREIAHFVRELFPNHVCITHDEEQTREHYPEQVPAPKPAPCECGGSGRVPTGADPRETRGYVITKPCPRCGGAGAKEGS